MIEELLMKSWLDADHVAFCLLRCLLRCHLRLGVIEPVPKVAIVDGDTLPVPHVSPIRPLLLDLLYGDTTGTALFAAHAVLWDRGGGQVCPLPLSRSKDWYEHRSERLLDDP